MGGAPLVGGDLLLLFLLLGGKGEGRMEMRHEREEIIQHRRDSHGILSNGASGML